MKNMKVNCIFLKTVFVFLFFTGTSVSIAQDKRMEKVQSVYDTLVAYEIIEPVTSLSIAILESGWFECKKCVYHNYKNLFGFRNHKHYMHFTSESECISYLKDWQEKFYSPWKVKHPSRTYHQFLVRMKYAEDMTSYLRKLKIIEGWMKKRLKLRK